MTLPRCRAPYQMVRGTLMQKSQPLFPVQQPAIAIQIRNPPQELPSDHQAESSLQQPQPPTTQNLKPKHPESQRATAQAERFACRCVPTTARVLPCQPTPDKGELSKPPKLPCKTITVLAPLLRQGGCNNCQLPSGDDRPPELAQCDARFVLRPMNVFEGLWDDVKYRKRYWNFVIGRCWRRFREDR